MQFKGIYEQVIDRRNRVTFPKAFFDELQDNVVFSMSEEYDKVIGLYPKLDFDETIEAAKDETEKKRKS